MNWIGALIVGLLIDGFVGGVSFAQEAEVANALVGNEKLVKLEERLVELHEEVGPSVVALIQVGRGRNNAVGGSGVVVSAEGHVLTAGHCFDRAGTKLEVLFNDGRRAKAVTLGHEVGTDYGLIQITDEGEWPFVEIGNPSGLVADEICVMYGHPDGPKDGRPAVARLGVFLGNASNGMLRTSCLMMPGDSGGPLFNLDGQVVGINSEIDMPVDANFHVSVASVKENWDRLLDGHEWGNGHNNHRGGRGFVKAPAASEDDDPGALLDGGRDGLSVSFKTVAHDVDQTVVRIRSVHGEEVLSTLGMVVDSEGWLVSKSSRIGDFDIRCDIEGQETCNAEIIARDAELDLVLLRVPYRYLTAFDSTAIQTAPLQVGHLLSSIGRIGEPILAGVVGAPLREIPRQKWGVLGVQFEPDSDGSPLIREVLSDGAALTAGLLTGDVLVAIDEQAIDSRNLARQTLRATHPNTLVVITVEREGQPRKFPVTLGSSDPNHGPVFGRASHPADFTYTSRRLGGFPMAIRHDMPLELWQCGGPIINTSGQVVGLNIARVERTGSLALPISIVLGFVDRARKADALD
jgi:serine protease Do